jgi:hypothetical protein
MGKFRIKFTEEDVVNKIELCKSVHNNKYTYDKVIYVDYATKVTITCPIHGDFEQNLDNHSKGSGCKQCTSITMSNLMRKGKEDFVNKSNNIHNNKYSYDKVPNSFKIRDKVIITCPIHGDFEQIAYSHKTGTGCQYCCGKRGYDKEKAMAIKVKKINELLYKVHVNDVKLVHVSENIDDKIVLYCKYHGEIKKNFNKILSGKICGKCLTISNKKKNTKKHIIKMKKIHNNGFDYVNLPDIIDNDTVLEIICKEHNNIFKTKKSNHIENKYGGCDECMVQYKDTRRMEQSEIIEKFTCLHGDRYSYDKVVYEGTTNKVIIGCKKHGDFLQSPASHLRGSGCPDCKHSTGEKLIQNLLKKMGIKCTTQKTFYGCINQKTNRMLPFDIYVPEFHTCIEYDGVQHYHSIDRWGGDDNLKTIQHRDNIKDVYCKDNDIDLIRIPYTMDKLKIVDLLNVKFNKNIVVDVKKRIKWVEVNIKERVRQYKTRSEFIEKDPTLYKYCRKNNLLDDVCEFMGFKNVPYTYERAKETCKQYTNYALFIKECSGLVSYINRNKFYELTKHMDKRRIKWTKDEVLEEIKKCIYRVDIRKKGGLYKAVVRYGLIDLLKNKTIHWNNEMVIEAFKKCKTISEVGKRFRGAEAYAYRNGLTEELSKYLIKR